MAYYMRHSRLAVDAAAVAACKLQWVRVRELKQQQRQLEQQQQSVVADQGMYDHCTI